MLLLIPQPVSPWPRSSATATPGGTREKYMSSLLGCVAVLNTPKTIQLDRG
jgi:hypothetical protein